MGKYFSDVIKEAKRVEWPKGKNLASMTYSVLIVCAIFAAIFWIMDFIINNIMRVMGI
ncbi:MAG: preprotein translocase subunit SecE [Mycoplasmataceae bacterium]|jgi:preprotein translocase subunit SecE|nr:preprotein translocase subunit SecE [Mycoplasmataceae bacterium]